MATKTLITLQLTNPHGEQRVIPVKPSVSIAIEERVGAPVWTLAFDGYLGAGARVGYEAGRDVGFIPPDVTFEEFLDADPGWEVTIIAPGTQIPRAIDVDADTDPDAPGE